ncbi:MAG: SUF system NifU family Fe-S cluster assembly protein [Acidobacteria bacterium]|nr:SUF system NifU family Fe-S cluster assembly protein [Acidobacteriota bacterium]
MSYLNDLYQEIILDHNKRPRNFGELKDANRRADGYNPLCGDKLTVYLHMDGDLVRDVSFQGSGCAISTASASLMTEALKGKTRAQVEELFNGFHSLVTGATSGDDSSQIDLGKLAAFHGVSEFPIRVKCATLAWHTMQAALENKEQAVSTE